MTRLVIREALSEPFEIRVRFSSADPDIALEPLLWTRATVEVYAIESGDLGRVADGVVEEAAYAGPGGRHGEHLYELVLRPIVHGLAHRVRSRIFQDQSVIDVAKQVLRDAGVPDDALMWDVPDYTVREYVTQWKESELAFFHRLLEGAGVFYWFEHDEAGHTMVIADRGEVAEPVDPSVVFGVAQQHDPLELASLWGVEIESKVTHDAVLLRDWNWETPQIVPQGLADADGLGFERYEHEGGFLDQASGDAVAAVRLTEDLCRGVVLRGKSSHPSMTVGRWFTLDCRNPPGYSGDYLVLEATQTLTTSAVSGGDDQAFETSFVAVPRGTIIRPARRTPKPRVWGKESAVITGPAGEEIHVDDFGRVKVHFYWDREGAVDDTATCWIRVQQLNTQGSMVLPRVGWEVDVGFLYGDPDRPVVMQKLYNEETLPPYELPANLMQMSLQSSSSPGGGGTNEIRMNDGAGGMELFIHAQKDFDSIAGNNSSEEVGVDATTQVSADSGAQVGVDETIDIGGNQAWSVSGGVVLDTAASKTTSIGGSDTWGVKAIYSNTADGSRTDDIGGLKNVLAQKVNETFNADHSLSVGGIYSINAGGPILEATAGNKDELVGGAKLVVCSGSAAENVGVGKVLTCGLASVKSGESISVTAKGAIAVNVGGPLAIKCGGDFMISGSSVTFNVGQAKLQGGGSKITANPGKVQVKGSSVGGTALNVKISGTVKYK